MVFLHLNHGVWGKRAFKSMRTPIVFALVRVMFPLFGRAVADLASGQVFGKRATSAFQKQPFRPAKAIFLQAKSRPLVLRKLVFCVPITALSRSAFYLFIFYLFTFISCFAFILCLSRLLAALMSLSLQPENMSLCLYVFKSKARKTCPYCIFKLNNYFYTR